MQQEIKIDFRFLDKDLTIQIQKVYQTKDNRLIVVSSVTRKKISHQPEITVITRSHTELPVIHYIISHEIFATERMSSTNEVYFASSIEMVRDIQSLTPLGVVLASTPSSVDATSFSLSRLKM